MQKMMDRNYLQLKAIRGKKKEELKNQLAVIEKVEQGPSGKDEYSGKLQRKFQEAKKLLAEDLSVRRVANDSKTSRNTIKKWRYFEVLPMKNASRHTRMQLYEDKVRSLLAENPVIEIKAIWSEIRAMEYKGKQTAAYDHIGRIAGREKKINPPRLPSVY